MCRTCSRLGLNVVVDVGHHDDYSRPLGILATVARDLQGLPAYFVGVRCPLQVIMAWRDAGAGGGDGDSDHGGQRYVTSGPGGVVPDVVHRWERAVHDPGIYDLEVDTSTSAPEECARAIRPVWPRDRRRRSRRWRRRPSIPERDGSAGWRDLMVLGPFDNDEPRSDEPLTGRVLTVFVFVADVHDGVHCNA